MLFIIQKGADFQKHLVRLIVAALVFTATFDVARAQGVAPDIMLHATMLPFDAEHAAKALSGVPVLLWDQEVKIFIKNFSPGRPTFEECLTTEVQRTLAWLSEGTTFRFRLVNNSAEANFLIVAAEGDAERKEFESIIDQKLLAMPKLQMGFYSSDGDYDNTWPFHSMFRPQNGITAADHERRHIGFHFSNDGKIKLAYIWHRENGVTGQNRRYRNSEPAFTYSNPCPRQRQLLSPHILSPFLKASGILAYMDFARLAVHEYWYIRHQTSIIVFRSIYKPNIRPGIPAKEQGASLKENLEQSWIYPK